MHFSRFASCPPGSLTPVRCRAAVPLISVPSLLLFEMASRPFAPIVLDLNYKSKPSPRLLPPSEYASKKNNNILFTFNANQALTQTYINLQTLEHKYLQTSTYIYLQTFTNINA